MALQIIEKLTALANAINNKTGKSEAMTIDEMIVAVNSIENSGSGGATEYETFDGEYEATPQIKSQTIATANKVMIKDFVVKEVPYFETTNNVGGTTITIGE